MQVILMYCNDIENSINDILSVTFASVKAYHFSGFSFQTKGEIKVMEASQTTFSMLGSLQQYKP